jgi:hypothetical protein
MNYDKLIESLSHIVENEKIEKKGLTMSYNLSKEDHINLSVDLYYKTNQQNDFNPEEDFEVEIGGILVKFVKNF